MLTVRTLEALKEGVTATEPGARGEGSLQARRRGAGVFFAFQYTNVKGVPERLSLGPWSKDGRAGLTLDQARTSVGELLQRYRKGERNLRETLVVEARALESALETARQVELRQQEVDALRRHASLGALMIAYVADLRRRGKASASAVERSLRLHVRDAWPTLWGTPAGDVSTDDLLLVVARVVDAGKIREAAKLRAYIRAAYAAAVRARQDARSLPALRQLKLSGNPARDLATIDGSSKARHRALSLEELRAYWRRATGMPGIVGALLRFHLLTGGQRIEQLARATIADFDPEAHTLRLLDPKGRRQQPRVHLVPLLPDAEAAMQVLRTPPMGPFVFSVTLGARAAVYTTVRQHVSAVAAAMVEEEEATEVFTPGDLRRTVETRLAAVGVSRDVRAQLQSHGLGGVQARHYDRHEYLQEKLDALEVMYRLLTGNDEDRAQHRRPRRLSGSMPRNAVY